MTGSVNIDIAQIAARQTSSASGYRSLKSSDNSSFSDDVLTSLRQSETSLNNLPEKEKTSSDEMDAIAEKIAELLKEENLLPESMENISSAVLTEAISAQLLQQNILSTSDLQNMSLEDLTTAINNVITGLSSTTTSETEAVEITPSLIAELADIVNEKSAQGAVSAVDNSITDTILNIKDSEKTEDASAESYSINKASISDILEALANIPEGSEKKELISTILKKLQTASNGALEELPENIDELSTEDLLALLQNNLAALTTADTATASETNNAVLNDITLQTTALDVNKNSDSQSSKILEIAKQLQNSSDNTSVDTDTEKEISNFLSDETTVTDITEETLFNSTSVESNIEAEEITSRYVAPILSRASNQTKSSSNYSITNQQQTAANITSKVSGISIEPEIVTSIAGASSDFNSFDTLNGSTSFSSTGQYGFLNNSNSVSNAGGFTNYLTSSGTSYTSSTTQMIALQIQQNADTKVSNMKLQLIPEELGKVDINLEFKEDGTIKAHLTVEKAETLSMLKKDSYQLEKLLQEAGFDTSGDSLSFDLQQQSSNAFADNQNNGYNQSDFSSFIDGDNTNNDLLQAQIAIEAAGYISNGRVNITV